MNTGDL